MKCTACSDNIEPHEMDSGNALEVLSPVTLRAGTFHAYCFSILCDEAELLPSKSPVYSSRYEQWLNHHYH